mgnify:CR=1 FL=1
MFNLPEEIYVKTRDGEEPVKVKILPNEYEEFPGCGALWGHSESNSHIRDPNINPCTHRYPNIQNTTSF